MDTSEEMLNYIAVFRGQFINKMSYIERSIELVIANHYCTDEEKIIEFIDFFIGEKHISFEAKRSTFVQIMEKHHPEKRTKYSQMFSHLLYVMPERNKVAHYLACITDEAIERFEKDKTFALVQYYKKTIPVWYDVERQTKIATALDELVNWLEIK